MCVKMTTLTSKLSCSMIVPLPVCSFVSTFLFYNHYKKLLHYGEPVRTAAWLSIALSVPHVNICVGIIVMLCLGMGWKWACLHLMILLTRRTLAYI